MTMTMTMNLSYCMKRSRRFSVTLPQCAVCLNILPTHSQETSETADPSQKCLMHENKNVHSFAKSRSFANVVASCENAVV
jgi:hypothetical protein